VKGVFLGYHLTIESNIPLLLRGSTEITLHVLCFRPTKPNEKCSKFDFLLPQIFLDLSSLPIYFSCNGF
jgi:hypothetical protein